MCRSQNTFPIVLLLVLSLTFGGSLVAQEQHGNALRGRALAEADATRQTAMHRLDTEAAYITHEHQQLFTDRMDAVIADQLRVLGDSYDVASAYLQSQIGISTPVISWFKSFWHSEEEAQRVFQEKIDAASTHAELPTQRKKFAKAVDAAVIENATDVYRIYRATFNDILYKTIRETGGLGRLTDDLVKELLSRIETTSQQLAIKEGVIDANAATALPGATMAVLSAMLAARIYKSTMQKVGGGAAVKYVIGSRIAALLLGPIGVIGLGIATIRDVLTMRGKAFEACNKVLRQSYDDMHARYTGSDFMTQLAEATVAGLEQQLETDRRAARIELDRYFRGVLVQAKSPGFDQFVEGRSHEEALQGYNLVAAVFGEEQVGVDIDTKYALINDIGKEKATVLVQKHAEGLVDLYMRQRKALVDVTRNTRYAEILLDVFQADDPEASLMFYKHSIDWMGSLDAFQTDALILTHQLHPTKRADEINKDALTILGQSVSYLAAIKQQAPETAATVVDWVLQGQMSGTLMQRLASHSDAATLLSLPIYLGSDAVSQALTIADEETLLQFLADFTAPGVKLVHSQALVYLREDATGHLKSYTTTPGGGRNAVLARHTLWQEYGGNLSADTDRTLHWVLAHTSIEPQAIHKGTIENLRALGIPGGVIPTFIAIPMAGMTASTGLVGPVFLLLIFFAGAGLIVMRFVFRLPLPLPRRRRQLPDSATERAIPVRPTPQVAEPLPRDDLQTS
jgi:hypothetical protein